MILQQPLHFDGRWGYDSRSQAAAYDVEVNTVNDSGRERRVLNNCLAVRVFKDETAFINLTAWYANASLSTRVSKRATGFISKANFRTMP
jgi:hypothetical protein